MTTTVNGRDYTKHFAAAMYAHSKAIGTNPRTVVFTSEFDGGESTQAWLNAMGDINPAEREAWQCRHCLKLIDLYGAAIAVTMDDDYKLTVEPYMWPVLPVSEDPEIEAAYAFYREASEKMRAFVLDQSRVVKREFFNYRTDKRTSGVLSSGQDLLLIGRRVLGGFHHMHLHVPYIHSRNFQPMSTARFYEEFIVNFKQHGNFESTMTYLSGIIRGAKEAHPLFEEQLKALKSFLAPFFEVGEMDRDQRALLDLRRKYLCHNRYFMDLANSLVGETLKILTNRGGVSVDRAIQKAASFFEAQSKQTAYKRSTVERSLEDIGKTFDYLKANGYGKSFSRRYAVETDIDRLSVVWRKSDSNDKAVEGEEGSPLDGLFAKKLEKAEPTPTKIPGVINISLNRLREMLKEDGISAMRFSPHINVSTLTAPVYADAKPVYKHDSGFCTVTWSNKSITAAMNNSSGKVTAVVTDVIEPGQLSFLLTNDLGNGGVTVIPVVREAIVFPNLLVSDLFEHRAVIEQVTSEAELENTTPGYKLLCITPLPGMMFSIYITQGGAETEYKVHCVE